MTEITESRGSPTPTPPEVDWEFLGVSDNLWIVVSIAIISFSLSFGLWFLTKGDSHNFFCCGVFFLGGFFMFISASNKTTAGVSVRGGAP